MTKLALSLIAAALMSGTAMAADLVVYEPVDMADPVAAGNFYASIFGGAAMLNDFEFESTAGGGIEGTMEFETGYSIDAALGYDFGNGLSVEGQLGYLDAGLVGGEFGGTPYDAEGSASMAYAMLNAWYGFDLGGVTPFIGGGVGFASATLDSEFSAPFTTASFTDTDYAWAAQIGAGLSVAVTEDIALTGRYRYLATGDFTLTDGDGDDITGSGSASIVDVGLKFSF
jgi:opacity protein-like surface antigen